MSHISVIIPVFNQEKYIGRCLRSILNQSIERELFEVIVINDGSTDSTIKILKNFENEVIIINNEKNIGLPASVNKGIKSAKGSFIVRLDSDDYVNTNFLLFLREFALQNTDYDAVATDYYVVDDNENIISRENCISNPIACGILFKIEHLISINLYDETFAAREEEDLRIRFQNKYNINRLAIPLYRYRKHETNLTNNKDKMDYFEIKLKKKFQSVKNNE